MPRLLSISMPPIKAYQQIALPLTVAMQNATAENWLYSNYIQVSCVHRMHYQLKGNKDNSLHYGFYNPEISALEPVDHISLEGAEQLFLFSNYRFIAEIINNGWYIYTDADMFYIEGNIWSGKIHYSHDLLIYGYDEKNVNIFMYDSTRLTKHVIRFEQFMCGYFSEYCKERFYRTRAILLKPKNRMCEINTEKIRWHIYDYLNGTETFAREKPNVFNPDSLTVNGIYTYIEFSRLLSFAKENSYKELRIVDFYCLYEHKRMMLDRVLYLRNKKRLFADDELINEFNNIQKLSNVIMMLALKNNASKEDARKNDTLNTIGYNLNILEEKEKKTWDAYISQNKGALM